MRAEQVTPVLAYHGEGPIWDHRSSRLLWLDSLAGAVLETDPASGATVRHQLSTVVGCIGLRESGGYVAALERRFSLVSADWSVESCPELWSSTEVRMNDGAAAPDGSFFAGSMGYAEPGRGALYRLAPDRSVATVREGLGISNGIDWSPTCDRAYYVDSLSHSIAVCSPDLSEQQPFVMIDPDDGFPDGLTVDSEGGIWVAAWAGSAVRRYSADGELTAVIELPVGQVTSCSFGRDDLATLFITTSAENLATPEPAAGALFAVNPGVTGLTGRAYRG